MTAAGTSIHRLPRLDGMIGNDLSRDRSMLGGVPAFEQGTAALVHRRRHQDPVARSSS